MNAPIFKVAVRDKDGNTHLFNLQHEDIPGHDCARKLVMSEVNGAATVLIGLPAPKREPKEQAA